MMLSDVCLSVAYIGPKLRTERPRKTKIGWVLRNTHGVLVVRRSPVAGSPRHTWLGHDFQGQKDKVKVTRPLCSPPCWRVKRLQRWTWQRVGRGKLLLRCRLLGGVRRFGAHGGRRGAGAYRGLQLVIYRVLWLSSCA